VISTAKGEWVTDLANMTCRNTTNNIVVFFKKVEGKLIGRIKELPMKIVTKWAIEGQGDTGIKDAVVEAEVMFFRAYLESEKNRTSEKILKL
jgi:hypothetical protein